MKDIRSTIIDEMPLTKGPTTREMARRI